LLEHGLVQMKVLPHACDGLRVGALADHVLYRVARRNVQEKKHHDHHAEERGNGEDESANYEREQATSGV